MPRLGPLAPFLLHEDSMVRDSVGFHFFESWSTDDELAPMVLQACRLYGEEASLNLLSFGCRFPLSAAGVVAALRALSATRPPFVEHWVAVAPLALLKSRADLLRTILSFRALERIERRFSLREDSTSALWRRLERQCHKLDASEARAGGWDEVEDLIEALTKFEGPAIVSAKLRGLEQIQGPRFRWALVELAGAMKLEEAVENLLDLLEGEDEALAKSAAEALARVGSTRIAGSIESRYVSASRRFRRRALAVLKALKLEASEALLRQLAATELDPALRGSIFDGLRFHYTDEAEALLRSELESPSSFMIREEIQKALSVFARIQNRTDPDVQRWRTELKARGENDVYFHIPFRDPMVP